jgi:hypothetical protein
LSEDSENEEIKETPKGIVGASKVKNNFMAFVKERIRLQTINQIASDRVKNDTELEIKASSPI